jgi:predicted nucleotidyltransferase
MSTIVQSKEALLERLAAHKKEIKSYGVRSIGLFGSFTTTDKIHPDSDVDLLVDFEQEKKTYDNFFDLSQYLEALLNRKVELVTPQSLNKYIGPHILNQVIHVAL